MDKLSMSMEVPLQYNMNIQSLLHKINNRCRKFRLQPIRVFCLHHVCAKFDEGSMCNSDWMDIEFFKNRVEQVSQDGYAFISFEDAYCKIQKDFFRCHKYAVITFDDGYKSLNEILPWLIEKNIPVTLFINGKYTDGVSQRQVEGKHFTYLTKDELQHYVEISNGLISLQSHGYEHLDATQMTEEEFKAQIEKNVDYISLHRTQGTRHQTPNTKHQFHAYTWGRHNAQTDAILQENNIIPVLVDGMKNYNDASCIHRELLENYDK